MTILYSSLSPVKPSRSFGRGILRSLPSYRADHTALDEQWLAADNARVEQEARTLDRLVDAMFAEVDATRRLEAGLCV